MGGEVLEFSTSVAEGKRARNNYLAPKRVITDLELLLGLLGTIGCAAALALARVFAFASVVPRLAAALALTGVLALTSVLFFDLLVVLLVFPLILALLLGAEGCLQRRKQSRSLDCGSAAGD
jgi:hypothetical protein